MAMDLEGAALAAKLEEGIEAGHIAPWFQPVMCPGGVQMLSAEALPRWDDPAEGIIAAGVFIEAAIAHGLLERISRILLDRSCSNYAAWRERGIAPPCVSVNMTGAELRSEVSVDQIRWAMDSHEMRPGQLAVEIAEGVLTEDGWEENLKTIRSLRALGVPFWLDDFGAGPCNLQAIGRVDFALAKVDRGIVMKLDDEPRAVERLRFLVDQAKEAKIALIAKGVETRGQIDTLVSLGCDGQQGFAIARPMAEDAFVEWLDLNTWPDESAAAG